MKPLQPSNELAAVVAPSRCRAPRW
jgi:hypothetical protein